MDAANEIAASFASPLFSAGVSHLLDGRLRVTGAPNVTTKVVGALYEVRIRYVSNTRQLTGNKKDDPLDESPTLHWQIGSTSEPIDSDIQGNPLINSVGDLFEGLTDEFTTLYLTYKRNESVYDIQKALYYGNKTNSDQFSITTTNGQLLVNVGQALCRSITAEEYATDAPHVPVSYNFEFREDGFDRRFLDQGLNGLYNDSGTTRIERFSNGKGKLVVKPVQLNGGLPIKQGDVSFKIGETNQTPIAGKLPTGAEAVRGTGNSIFLKFRRKKYVAFSGLNI